jgi:hypothetical protein
MLRESAEKAGGEAAGRHTEPAPQRFVLRVTLDDLARDVPEA